MEKSKSKATAVKLYGSAAEIDKAILSIKGRGVKLDADIQKAALSIIKHVDQHSDTTIADRLFNAMPAGSRRLALAEYLVAFGKMRTLKNDSPDDKARLALGHVFAFDKERKTDMEEAVKTPWYEMRKEPDVAEVFDVQAAVAALLKRAAKAKEKGVRIEHAELLEKLRAAA